MRIVALIIIVILIFMTLSLYFKSTKKALLENVNTDTTTDTRIEHTKKVMEEFNRGTEERAREVEKIIDE